MKKSTTTQPKLIPLGERVLVLAPRTSADEKKEKVIGGIVIPESASDQTKQLTGETHVDLEVIAVGEACKLVKPGDKIVALTRHVWNVKSADLGREHQMVMEKDIVAVVKG